MPGFDGRGPDGRGPMTGRGMGYCNDNARDDIRDERYYEDERDVVRPRYYSRRNLGRGYGRGYGRGLGRGFGRRNRDW